MPDKGKYYVMTFEAFEIADVRETDEAAAEDTDFWLEISFDKWKEMIENIKANGKADLHHTLNTIDLEVPGRPRALQRRLPPRRLLPLQPDVPVLLRQLREDRHDVRVGVSAPIECMRASVRKDALIVCLAEDVRYLYSFARTAALRCRR